MNNLPLDTSIYSTRMQRKRLIWALAILMVCLPVILSLVSIFWKKATKYYFRRI